MWYRTHVCFIDTIFLYIERNWNIRIPGFASDDIRPLRKPTIPSSHQTKLQAVNAAKTQLTNSSHKKSGNNNNNNNSSSSNIEHQN
jgi:transcription initiation factor TFIID subunit TAF12